MRLQYEITGWGDVAPFKVALWLYQSGATESFAEAKALCEKRKPVVLDVGLLVGANMCPERRRQSWRSALEDLDIDLHPVGWRSRMADWVLRTLGL